MDSVGSLHAKDLTITRDFQGHKEQPNVITLHPSIDSYNDQQNIICIVDLAQQHFQIRNQEDVNSRWWLSFSSYCKRCSAVLAPYLSDTDAQSKVEMDEEEEEEEEDEQADNTCVDDVSRVIFSFLSGAAVKLSGDHHVADLFMDAHFDTDSLITVRCPKPKSSFDFLTFSADNPYAQQDASHVNNEQNQQQADGKHDADDADAKQTFSVDFLRADCEKGQLLQWFSVVLPQLTSPKSTSREMNDAMYNSMLEKWSVKLSQDLRFLLIFPEKLGEIADVYLNKHGKLYWAQSLHGQQCNKENGNSLRRMFTLNECDVTRQFQCRVLKLLVTVEFPARFKIVDCDDNKLVVWNFSINGASEDLFTIVDVDGNGGGGGDDADGDSNAKWQDKTLAVDNAQNFNNYRFKDGNLRDLIRDIPKICSMGGALIFGGACFLSILVCVDDVHVYDTEQDSKRLICKQVPNGFCYDAWIPIQVCPPKDIAKWITDFVPFAENSILARWGSIGKSVYGVWKCVGAEAEVQCVASETYDEQKWSDSIMACYHFGDRIKTILLAIELQLNNNDGEIENID